MHKTDGTAPDIIYGDMMAGNGRLLKAPDNPTFLDFVNGSGFAHQAVFYKRELFYKHHFYDESFRIWADRLLHIELAVFRGATLCRVPVTFANYDTGGVSGRDQETVWAERRRAIAGLLPARLMREFEEQVPHAFIFGRWTGKPFLPRAPAGRLMPYAPLFNNDYALKTGCARRLHVFITTLSLKILLKTERLIRRFFHLFRA
jgi:hypothetical protein